MKTLLGCLFVLGVAGGTVLAASDGRWIHVRVDDTDKAKGRVDLQVPIELVASVLPILKGAHARGTIQLDDKSIDLAELRDYWTALSAAKDGEYLTLRDEDSDVRIAKRGGTFLLTVNDEGGRNRVRMKIPLPLIDAVLGGGDTLDLGALGGAIAKAPEGELLAVDDEDSHVRIWIDGAASPAREDAP